MISFRAFLLRAFLILGLLQVSCAHSIHDVYVSDINQGTPFAKTKQVVANSSQFEVLWTATSTDYVEQAYTDLQEKCPKGDITGITTQFSTSLGFLSWHNKILMKGYCVQR